MPVVQTTSGLIRGCESDQILVFRGVPFAAPPVGALRFRPPEGLPPWSGVRDATRFAPPAAQNPDRLDAIWGEMLAPGEEDCLYLNVWSPGLDAPLRPVMVWIHGGGFIFGSGRWGWYEGSRLAGRGDLVVVTVNYRLGAFGFLDLSRVGGRDYAASGNCGLLDLVAALRWVRDNIARFGGDPDRVTILGESAGSVIVSCLMACPQAQGLFHRALCMSGPPSMVRSSRDARRTTERFMEQVAAKEVGDLLEVPAWRILEVQDQLLRTSECLGEMLFGPVIDGEVLPAPPLHAIRQGSARHVSLLTGTTRDEMRLWTLYSPRLRWLDPRSLTVWLRSLGLSPGAVLATYRADRPRSRPGDRTLAIVGDVFFLLPQIRLAEAQSRHRSDTRMYLFEWNTPVREGRLGSPHAVDIPFFSGNLDARGVAELTGPGPERHALSDVVQGAWIAFARDGDPNHDALPAWPPYETNRRATMIFNTVSQTRDDPSGAIRRIWDPFPFDGLRPGSQDMPRIGDITRFYRRRWRILVASSSALLLVCLFVVIYSIIK